MLHRKKISYAAYLVGIIRPDDIWYLAGYWKWADILPNSIRVIFKLLWYMSRYILIFPSKKKNFRSLTVILFHVIMILILSETLNLNYTSLFKWKHYNLCFLIAWELNFLLLFLIHIKEVAFSSYFFWTTNDFFLKPFFWQGLVK